MKKVHLYGGLLDGLNIDLHPEAVSFRTKGDTYSHSAAWSAQLGKETFVHTTINGNPPRKVVAA